MSPHTEPPVDATDPSDAVDLAVVAYREDEVWQVEELEPELVLDFETLTKQLRRRSADDGAIAMVAYDEDFLLVVRVRGARVQVLLSDVTAALEWDVARGALEALGEDLPDEDDDPETVGDVDLLEDLGLTESDVDEILDDEDLFPDEMIAGIAVEIGLDGLVDEVRGLSAT
ncbi:tRNA adenosine deaminase-associated protein [Nocardioidaceae bacterium]|nr:tRNA adenosine deaminase-associated protein [Nocardioidaceae bacterium]